MGNSTPRNGSVSAGITFKSCLCSLTCEESCVKREKYTSGMEKSMKTIPLEDLEISSSIEEEEEEHWIVQELGASLSEVLHVHDNLGPVCVSNLAFDQDENCNHQETEPLLLDTCTLDGPNMHEIVLCSSVVQPYPLTLDAIEELSSGTEGKLSLEAPASAYHLPAKKLISALKRSCEKQGEQGERLSTKSVKWAPEVYDPPITSSSHTMKGHHRHYHHKTRKDYNMHNYTKNKSSRGSERKHAHRRSSGSSSLVDPRILRLQALRASNRLTK